MSMPIPLCAALLVCGALAGCGDGASDSASVATSQNDAATLSPSQPVTNSTGAYAPSVSLDVRPAQSSVSPVSDPRSELATNAPIDPPSLPTAMSPGVIAS
ncbi:MAG TPA: hypothetical protein VL424_18915, partial [Pararobbsia sp.]|nr:hypothetical protein [Pararobbsia sp.]